MPTPPDRPVAAAVLAEAQAALQAWATAHPQATLYEMEIATERHLARVRAALLGEVVATTSAPPTHPTCPTCPTCGAAMHQAGQQERTITLPHNETLPIRGPRYRCPACGAGLFPPG